MSATNRGAERSPNDFYGTPAWAVRRYLDSRALALPSTSTRWLEPGAGRGAIIHATDEWFEGHGCDRPNWLAIDLPPAQFESTPHVAWYYGDFLDKKVSADKRLDFCIGNPPYKAAQEFIEKALTLAHEVAFLLRLNFLESGKRFKFFTQYPCDVKVLPNRPSFTTDGHTDATAYAWFEFGEGHGGKFRVLGTTPKAERLADRMKPA